MFFSLLITLYRTCLPILSRASVPTHLSFPPTLPWLEPLLESRICNCSHHRISCVSRCISGLLLFPGIKIGGREVQPSAALYPTVRLSPWRQVRKNIHSRVGTPGSTWSVLPQVGHPPPGSLSPPWLWDMGLTHWRQLRTIQSRVATPGTTWSVLRPGGHSSPGPTNP